MRRRTRPRWPPATGARGGTATTGRSRARANAQHRSQHRHPQPGPHREPNAAPGWRHAGFSEPVQFADRQRSSPSEPGAHTIAVPWVVTPAAPGVLQYEPGCTVPRDDCSRVVTGGAVYSIVG
jgi:hypothetical protein